MSSAIDPSNNNDNNKESLEPLAAITGNSCLQPYHQQDLAEIGNSTTINLFLITIMLVTHLVKIT